MLACDFETTTGDQRLKPKERSTEVWLSCFCDIKQYDSREDFIISYDIKSFFLHLLRYIQKNRGSDDKVYCFFHNLKFDGSFICNFLLKNKIPFQTFINNMGAWYTIEIHMPDYKLIFKDSLKILNFSIRVMANLFDCAEKKGDTPLLEFKPKNVLPQWEEYVKTDVSILAKGLHSMFNIEGFQKFTSASEALYEFKKTVSYRKLFPILPAEVDTELRHAYRGGWTYANPKYANKIIEELIHVYDINSMYPAKMLDYPMPYGYPEIYEPPDKETIPELPNGKYYVARVQLLCDLKEGFLPTLQTRDTETALKLGIRKPDYITTTHDEFFTFYLTNFDVDLLLKHYDCEIYFEKIYLFETRKGIFDDYITKYKELKENAETPAQKQKAKIMLNSLYGKFGSKIEVGEKELKLEDDVLKFEPLPPEEVEPNYIPVAIFITSIARHGIISDAQANYDHFLYADTDSLHLIYSDDINLEIDDSKFGLWKLELLCKKAKYIRAKLYMELEYCPVKFHTHTPLHVKGAGMTEEVKKQVTFENFNIGEAFEGKRASKQVKGGMIIYDTTYEIKEGDFFGRF